MTYSLIALIIAIIGLGSIFFGVGIDYKISNYPRKRTNFNDFLTTFLIFILPTICILLSMFVDSLNKN